MSAFKSLRDVSNKFEEELRRVSTELFAVKIEETFEDCVSKKMRDLSFFNSKLRLLQAKPVALTPQITEGEKDEDTVFSAYEDTVIWKIIEERLAKSVAQSNAVRTLVTTPNRNLDPELVERKERIIHYLKQYVHQESQLRHLDSILKETEEEHSVLVAQFNVEVGELRQLKASASEDNQMMMSSGPLYSKLSKLVVKMELMRWLINKLVTARTKSSFDWLSEPQQRLYRLLKLARQMNTVELFIEQN